MSASRGATAVPVPLVYRLSAAFGGLLMGLIFSMAFMVETTEHRVAKAGYPPGTAARRAAMALTGFSFASNGSSTRTTARSRVRYL